MCTVKLKIDVSGTECDEAWSRLLQFEPIEAVSFGCHLESSGPCRHLEDRPHTMGEWVSAEVKVKTPLLAQYAVSHYLEQDRVLDAEVVA
jgi:hypothetical protein